MSVADQPETDDYGMPTITRLEDAQVVDYYANTFSVMLRAEQTAGKFFMTRSQHFIPIDSPPFHRHTLDDELWIIHSGQFRFWIGGTSLETADVHDVSPGTVVYGPRFVPHTFQVLGDEGDVSVLWTPSVGENYYLHVPKTEKREDFLHPEGLASMGVEIVDRAPVDGE